MPTYPVPANEAERLATLRRYRILDTLPEAAYDDIARLASVICQTPIAAVSLVDNDRQWFKSKVGLDVSETSRDLSFCAYTLSHPHDLLVVPDAEQDERFAHNALVKGGPEIRFYAGAPLATEQGEVMGSLCVIDRVPRELTKEQREALRALSRLVMEQLDARLRVEELALQVQMRQQVEIALRSTMAEVEDLYDNAPCGYQSFDTNNVIQRINETELRWLGYTREEVVGKMTLFDLVVPKYHDLCRRRLEELREKGAMDGIESEYVRKDGTTFPVLVSATAIYNDRHDFVSARASVFDNSLRQQAEQALRESESRFHAFMDNGPMMAFIKDAAGRYIYANLPMLKRFQRTREEILGKRTADLWPSEIAHDLEEHDLRVMQTGKATTFEEVVPSPDGATLYWLSFKFPLEDAAGRKYVAGIAVDITERKFYERQLENYQRQLEEVVAKLEEVAITDALTGLKNKGAFENRLHEEWERARRYKLSLSLLLVDLDFFKQYNDTFGHPAGDEILRRAAQILMEQARPSDFVARIGGEEFAIILANTDIEGAYIVAERLRRAIEGASWPRRAITSSIGIAAANLAATPEELVNQADLALYEAKHKGRNRVARATAVASS